jgi:hypothetical protein
MSTSPANVSPNYPLYTLGDLYLQGGRLTYVDNSTFTVAPGQFRSSNNINDIILPAAAGTPTIAVTVNTAINGLNGLDTGTIAGPKIYYVYAVSSSLFSNNPANSDYLAPGVMLSLSLVQPNLPAGYDMWRRIGAIRIKVTPAPVIEPFMQTGYGQNRTMRYTTFFEMTEVTGSMTTPTTIGDLSALVPARQVDVLFYMYFTPGAAGSYVSFSPYGVPEPAQTTGMTGLSTTLPQGMPITCPCGLSGTNPVVPVVNYITEDATVALLPFLTGYIDAL